MQGERLIQPPPSRALPPISEAKRGILAFATAIGNEIEKGLIDLWRGKIASVLELIGVRMSMTLCCSSGT